jgi:hypothetical protein
MKNTQLANPALFGARQFCFINRIMKSSFLKDNKRSFLSNEFLSTRTSAGQGFMLQAQHNFHSN